MKHEAKRRRFAAGLLIAAVLLLTAALAGLYIRHHAKLRREARLLQQRGWQYADTDSGYALSFLKSGDDAGAHRIVAIADMGVSDYSVQLRLLNASLSDSDLLVCIDRAGCGLSIDTDTPQTVQQIVADYRSALKHANIEPPYILLPHAFGGVYATYWESQYPDEIEGVFFLDGTCLTAGGAVPSAETGTKMQQILRNFGLNRLEKHSLPAGFSAAERQSASLLTLRGTGSSAQCSEMQLAADNYQTAYESIVTNTIPKAYVNTASYQTQEDWLAADDWARTFRQMQELSEAERLQTAAQKPEECRRYTEQFVQPYLEQLGNCTCFALPGDTCIYMQKPMQCAVLFTQFLTELEQAE